MTTGEIADPTTEPRPPERADAAGAVCPYKGLATYQTADAELFHGRNFLESNATAPTEPSHPGRVPRAGVS